MRKETDKQAMASRKNWFRYPLILCVALYGGIGWLRAEDMDIDQAKAQEKAELEAFEANAWAQKSLDEIKAAITQELADAEARIEAVKAAQAEGDNEAVATQTAEIRRLIGEANGQRRLLLGKGADVATTNAFEEQIKGIGAQLQAIASQVSLNVESVRRQEEFTHAEEAVAAAEKILADAQASYLDARANLDKNQLEYAADSYEATREKLAEAANLLEGVDSAAAKDIVRRCEDYRVRSTLALVDIHRTYAENDPVIGDEEIAKCEALLAEATEKKYQVAGDSAFQPADVRASIEAKTRNLAAVKSDLVIKTETAPERLMPDKAEEDLVIRTKIASGVVLMEAQRYGEARECFDEVLKINPYELSAIRNLALINDALNRAATEKLESIIKERIAEVRWKWSDPVKTFMDSSSEDIGSTVTRKLGDVTGVNRKLDSIVLSKIVFDNDPLKEVLTEILPRKIREADEEGIGINIVPLLTPLNRADSAQAQISAGAGLSERDSMLGQPGYGGPTSYRPPSASPYGGPNTMGPTMPGRPGASTMRPMGGPSGRPGNDFASQLAFDDNFLQDTPVTPEPAPVVGPVENNPVSMSLLNVTPREVLAYIAMGNGLRIKVTDSAVIVAHPSVVTSEMETRDYSINAGVFDTMRTRSRLSSLDLESDDDDDDDDDDDNDNNDNDSNNNDNDDQQQRMYSYFEDVQSQFHRMGVDNLPGSSITYVPRAGVLIVHHTPENQQRIAKLLEKINKSPELVTIEAKFVEIEQTNLQALGFEWSILGGNRAPSWVDGDYTFGSRSGSDSRSSFNNGTIQVGLGRDRGVWGDSATADITKGLRYFSSWIGDASISDDIFNVYSIIGDYAFETIIHAIEREENADVLSAPKVTTISGKTAQLKMVTVRYFPTSWNEPELDVTTNDDGAATSTSFKPATPEFDNGTELGVILDVTPVVAGGDDDRPYTVELELLPQVVEFVDYERSFSYNMIIGNQSYEMPMLMPITTKREVNTKVIVYDNETLVLGGMIKEELRRYEDKVPFLGSIPVLGQLFRSKGEKSIKTNLMIFVNVRLVKPDGMPKRDNGRRGLPDFKH